jgi:hypothetical protein
VITPYVVDNTIVAVRSNALVQMAQDTQQKRISGSPVSYRRLAVPGRQGVVSRKKGVAHLGQAADTASKDRKAVQGKSPS